METEISLAEARPLSLVERRLLDALLLCEFDGVEQLRPQADTVLAYSACTCGCGTIGFEHPNGLRPRSGGNTAPLKPYIHDEQGNLVGGLILFVGAGLLSGLEVFSYVSQPVPLPEVESIHFERRIH